MTTRSAARPDNRVLNLLRAVSAFAVVLGHVRLLFVAFARGSEMQTDRVRAAVDRLARPALSGVAEKS